MTKELQGSGGDINFEAYQERLKSGEFDELKDETWLAFSQGYLVAVEEDRETIIEEIEKMHLGEVFLTEVRPQAMKLQGFFVDKDGELHRGVTTIMSDPIGTKYRVGLEWGSGRAFMIGEVKDEDKANENEVI